jgi:hypothetical protein
MITTRSVLAATIFGFLAQIGVQPSPPKPEHSAQTLSQTADNVFATINSEVANSLQTPLKSREIRSRDLAGIIVLLDSSKVKLQEGRFEEKFKRASKQMEIAQNQAQAVLNDPGNKDVFAASFDPENSLTQLRLQKATAEVLERKVERFRTIMEELRKCTAILEGVTPSEQLTERIKLRLTQLLSEWKEEPAPGADTPSHFADRKPVSGTTSPRPETKPEPGFYRLNHSSIQFRPERSEVSVPEKLDKNSISNSAKKVISMKQQKFSEKLILRYINSVKEPFGVSSAEQILLLQEEGIPASLITAMLRRDNELRQLATLKSRGK